MQMTIRRRVWRLAAFAVGIVAVGEMGIQAQVVASEHGQRRSQPLESCSATSAFLQLPTSVIQSNAGNLLIAESGTTDPNTGRISIVDLIGNRRTLVAGLPSGISDVGTPSGPSGLFMRGRTLYVAIGSGDVGRNGPIPGTSIPNPAGPPSSPIFASVLAMHFGSRAEQTVEGFDLTPADHQALADHQIVRLSSGGQHLTIELIAKLPEYTPKPLAAFPDNVDLSNPFALVSVGNQLYVTDGGQNAVWQIDVRSGEFWKLAQFADIPNPLFPAVGGPYEEAVPTGIAYSGGRLLVTLFTGAPFAPGTSSVQQVRLTGSQTPFLTGLKTAIGVLSIDGDDNDRDDWNDDRNRRGGDRERTGYLVLQNASTGPFFGGPGLVLRVDSSHGSPTVLANCVNRPTAMTLDSRTNTIYVTDLEGHLVAIHVRN